MTKNRFLTGTLAAALAFGMAVIGCATAAPALYADNPRLDGVWVYEQTYDDNDITDINELILVDGRYLLSLGGGFRMSRGNYTVRDGVITLNPTHVHGAGYTAWLPSRWNGWLSGAAFAARIDRSRMTPEQVDAFVTEHFSPFTVSVRGGAIVFPSDDTGVITGPIVYTRK